MIHFNFLVNTFSFSIRLRVIGGGEGNVISKGFSKLFGKGEGKLEPQLEIILSYRPNQV